MQSKTPRSGIDLVQVIRQQRIVIGVMAFFSTLRRVFFPPVTDTTDARFKVGTLTYTKMGLVALFAWLLWGDFCYNLHEAVVNSVLPLIFKRNGAPNWLMGVLITSMPAAINFTLNPIISTASDRARTGWGRRKPFLAISAPINALCLILMAFTPDLAGMAQDGFVGRVLQWSPGATMVAVVAICFVFFRLTDLFVGTVYYYLFADVVPAAFLARFMALFRVVATLSGSLYSAFIYQYAETHMRPIFLCAGVLYLIGYTIMCLKVKEGKYPPPPVGMHSVGLVQKIKTYCSECFFHRFYWYFFLTNATWNLAGAMGPYGVFLARDSLGLTLAQIGNIAAVTALVSATLLYFAGVLADRLHPLRFMRWTMVMQTVWALTSLNWLFWDPSPRAAWIVMVSLTVVSVPLGVMHHAAAFPMIVRLLPKERFGQFSAANAMVISAVTIIGGLLGGLFLDLMKKMCGGSDYAYRYIPVWQLGCMFLALVMLFRLYREWIKRGGLKNFTPPAASDDDEPPADGENGEPPAYEGVAAFAKVPTAAGGRK